MSHLERLTAALMDVDGSVTFRGRTGRAMHLLAGHLGIVLVEVLDLATFEADSREMNDALQPGQSLVIVGVDPQRLGAAAVLERAVPAATEAWVWTPGDKPINVRGGRWKNLEI